MRFEALDYVYYAEVIGKHTKLRMKDVSVGHAELKFVIEGEPFVGSFIDTGSPHVVLLRDGVDSLDVFTLGKCIRNEALLLPEGANVDFVQAIGKNKIKIRTYERGVETETLACGTGAVASAIMAAVRLDLRPPIAVQVQSGEEMLVHIKISDEVITDVFLQGSAHILFDARLMYDDASCKVTPVEPTLREAQSAPVK